MVLSQSCLNARSSLDELRALKLSFDSAFDAAVASGQAQDISKAQQLKRDLESQMKELQDMINVEYAERLYDLRRQYDSQVKLLQKAGLVEERIETNESGVETKVLFMKGIDDKEYPLPSYETIVSRLAQAERRELLTTKVDQGFKKLLLVPFGMSLDTMIESFKQYLRAYKKTHSDFALDENEPAYVWNEYNAADKDGTLLYDPILFDQVNHQGKTKKEILSGQASQQDPTSGWRILMLQAGENNQGFRGIPREGAGTSQGTTLPRQDIEAGSPPNGYLSKLLDANQPHPTDPANTPYSGEHGMTPEEWIALFMTQLEQTGELLDDYQDNTNSIAYLTGVYFPASGYFPLAYWHRGGRRAYLRRNYPGDVGDRIGVRCVVRV